jgi:hypothetical protein
MKLEMVKVQDAYTSANTTDRWFKILAAAALGLSGMR